jgi:hypothetical protein
VLPLDAVAQAHVGNYWEYHHASLVKMMSCLGKIGVQGGVSQVRGLLLAQGKKIWAILFQ